MSEKLMYRVSRGKDRGMVLRPHKYQDGCFRAHKTDSKNDPDGREVATEAELIDLVREGYHVRMSCPGHAPSTVKPDIVVE